MPTSTANEDIRTSFWPRVREFAVPASMIETATARRLAGDWAGAGAAAGFDVDPDLRAVARDHGHSVASLVRADLRALAPDLLRRHLPRVTPDGLLRPGVTLTWRGTRPSRARSIWWPGPHPPGRTPAGGSASRCGHGPAPPAPYGIRVSRGVAGAVGGR